MEMTMHETKIRQAAEALNSEETLITVDLWVGTASATMRRNDQDRDEGTGIDLTFEEMAEVLRRSARR